MDAHAGHSGTEQAQARSSLQAVMPPSFLIEDANVTIKAYVRWYRQDFIKSHEFSLLPKALRNHLHELCQVPPGWPTHREKQSPEVIGFLERWEALPLQWDSAELRKARSRLIRDLILAGNLYHYQVLGLGATYVEIGEARRWFRKNRDGQITTYQSIPLLWKYKNLQWDPVAANFKTVAATVAPVELEDCPAYSEMYCISKGTFAMLLNQNSEEPTDDLPMTDDYRSNNGAVTTGATDLEAAMARMILFENP